MPEMHIPQELWDLGERKYGTKPTNRWRILLWMDVAQGNAEPPIEVVRSAVVVQPERFDDALIQRRDALNLQPRGRLEQTPDQEFLKAYAWGARECGGEEELIATLEGKVADGLNSPRAFLVKQYRNRAGAALKAV